MILSKLLVTIGKEIRVVIRDKEALLMLFGLPLVFVTIMSLALQDAFKERGGVVFSVKVLNADDGEVGRDIVDLLTENKHFQIEAARAGESEAELKKGIDAGRYKLAVIIPPDATKRVNRRVQDQLGITQSAAPSPEVAIRLLSDPAMQGIHRGLAVSSVNRILQGVETRILLEQVALMAEEIGGFQSPATRKPVRIFSEIEADGAADGAAASTSVQQNMPAWSLFAMFFLVIPLSGTFIKERQQGSLTRLKCLPVPTWIFMAGKSVPYFIINQIQFISMMLMGMYVLPFFGGEVLHVGNSATGIALLTVSASAAAIGYGLLVATFCRTPEQATTFGGTSIIIFAAIGGIMVPKFVMPAFLQRLTGLSPMSWGLEGFLDIFVRNGTVYDVLPRSSMLLAFASFCMGIAILRLKYIFSH